MAGREAEPTPRREDDGAARRVLWRRVLLRLVLLYFVPLLLLSLFFNVQYDAVASAGERVHLVSTAERRAARLDRYLGERIVELSRLANDSDLSIEGSAPALSRRLEQLRRVAPAAVELGLVDAEGRSVAVAMEGEPWSSEAARRAWWDAVERSEQRVWLVGAARSGDDGHIALTVGDGVEGASRAAFVVFSARALQDVVDPPGEPERWRTAVVGADGGFPVTPATFAAFAEGSPLRPPTMPRTGSATLPSRGRLGLYGYSWLSNAPWAVVVGGAGAPVVSALDIPLRSNVLVFSLIFLVIGLVAIVFHARTQVHHLWEARRSREELSGQLVHAAKLASVGELAAGIAHEINNPLAIIAEEIGLLEDLRDPELDGSLTDEELATHLRIMHDAVFRARDITRKLLGFVRKTEVRLEPLDLHEVIDAVADGYLGRHFELSGVKVQRVYEASPSRIVTDRNQLEQVLLNLMKNAVDAMGGSGTLTLRTSNVGEKLRVSVADTGCGMSREQMENIFVPFYTTKDLGEGTGLGLSVSKSIIESLGGDMFVDSSVCEGSTFTIELPAGGEDVPKTRSET